MASRARPPNLPRLHSVPPPNNGALPRPHGVSKPHPPEVHRPHPVIRRTAVHQQPQPRPLEPESDISFGLIVSIVVVLLLAVTLLFNFDPLKGVISIESAERRASANNASLVIEKEKTKLEREMMADERVLWEKAREVRVPQGAFWGAVSPALDCRAYGKREYSGSLRNIPKDWDPIDACMNMPVEIRGVEIRRPDRCARVFVFPEVQVQAFWMVDWGQSDCKPWYRDFQDKGCTGRNSGKRRIEAQIVGINDKGGQDWRLLCQSTPLVWDMRTYSSPTSCEERFWWRKAAVWEVADETC